MNRTSFVFLAICWMRVFFSIVVIVDGIPMPSSSAADRHNRFNPSKGRSRQASPSLNPTRSPNPTRTGRPSGKNMNENGDEGNGYGDRTRSPTLLPESSSSFPTKKKNAPSVFVSPSSSRPSSTLSPSRFSHTPSYHSPSSEPSFTYSALPSLKHSSSPSQLSHVPSHGSASPSLKHSSSPSQLSHVPSYGSASPSLKQSASPSQLSQVPSYRSVSPSLKQSPSPSQFSQVPSYHRSASPSLKQSASPSQFAHMPSYRSVSPSLKQSASPSYESSSSPSSKDNDLNPSNGDSLAPSSATSDVTSSPPTQTISTSPSTDPTSRDPEPMPSFQDPVTIDRCESMDGVFGSTSNSSVTIFFIYEVQYNASDVSASDVTSSGIQTNILPSLESFMTKLLAKTVFTTGCANGRTSTRYASASVKASLSATGIAMDDLQSAIVGISGWPMDRVITNMSCQSFAGGDENGTNITSSTDNVSHVKCRRVDGRMTIHLFREEEDQVNADVAPTTADDANAEIDTRRVLKTIRSRRLSNSNENDSIGENVATYALSIIENLMLKGDMDHAHEDIIRVNFIKAKGQVISGGDGDPTNGSMERNQDIGLNKEDGFSTYEKVLLGTACGVAFIVLFFGWTCRKQYLVEKNISDDAMHQIDSQDTDDGTDDAPFETSQRLDFTMLCLDETTEAEVLNEVEKELGLNSDFDQDLASDDNVEKEVESDGGSGSGVGDCDGIIGIERVHTIDDLLNVGMHRTIAGAVDGTSSSQDNDECETINFE